MDHVAIDLGGRESQICVRKDDGAVIEERRWRTRALDEYLAKKSPSRVVMETCSESFRIADLALKYGHQVRVVPATLVRALGVGERGVKTDRRDAQKLSEVSCRIDLPSVHIPAAVSRQRKAQCGMRETQVQARTKLINSVRGWLRAEALRPRGGSTETFAARVRALYQAQQQAAPAFVERQLIAIEQLTEHIRQADRELAETARGDSVCQRLMSAPGVGPVTAVRFVAALDEVSRFSNAHAVESYLGLVPGESSSSDRQRRTGITKAGSPKVRWALVQAAWAAKRSRAADPMVEWSLEVEKRRGRRIAITALARRLAGVLYAMWRDGTTYDAAHRRKP
jgi:transposase